MVAIRRMILWVMVQKYFFKIPNKTTKNVQFFQKSFADWNFQRIFAVPNEGNQIIGVWRSWLAHLVWDQRVLCSSHSTPTKEQLIFNCSFFCLPLTPHGFILHIIKKLPFTKVAVWWTNDGGWVGLSTEWAFGWTNIGGQEVKWILKQVKSNDKGIRNRKVVWRSQGP